MGADDADIYWFLYLYILVTILYILLYIYYGTTIYNVLFKIIAYSLLLLTKKNENTISVGKTNVKNEIAPL